MIQHKIGDLFNNDADVIVHQVNCKGVMGSGVAKQVKEFFPCTFAAYKDMCQTRASHNALSSLLGKALVRVEELEGREVWVANLFAQLDYGRDGKCYTDYTAFREALKSMTAQLLLFSVLNERDPKIAIPYRIGCDRGGGDWDTVRQIIEDELGDLDVTLYELPSNAPGGFNGKKDCQHG